MARSIIRNRLAEEGLAKWQADDLAKRRAEELRVQASEVDAERETLKFTQGL